MYISKIMNTKESDIKSYSISELGPFDVLCGRDKCCMERSGNLRFQALIKANVQRYSTCKSRHQRSETIAAIAKDIQDDIVGPIRFFKRVEGNKNGKGTKDGEALVELLDEKQSHTKIAHALRDCANRVRKREAKEKPALKPGISQDLRFQRQILNLSSSTTLPPLRLDPLMDRQKSDASATSVFSCFTLSSVCNNPESGHGTLSATSGASDVISDIEALLLEELPENNIHLDPLRTFMG